MQKRFQKAGSFAHRNYLELSSSRALIKMEVLSVVQNLLEDILLHVARICWGQRTKISGTDYNLPVSMKIYMITAQAPGHIVSTCN